MEDLNLRPPRCERGALTAELTAPARLIDHYSPAPLIRQPADSMQRPRLLLHGWTGFWSILRQAQDERGRMIIRPYIQWLVGWCFDWLAPFGFSGLGWLARGRIFPPGADCEPLAASPPQADFTALRCQHTAGLGTQLFDLLFRVLGTPVRACLRAGWAVPGTPVGHCRLGVRSLSGGCHLGRLRFWVLTGLAVEAKSCLFGDWD